METPFDRAGLARGLLKISPLALGVFFYGVLFGVLAGQAGLSLAQASGMSVLVFAGAAQLISLDLWIEPLPVAALVATVLAVNLRHVLMSASLHPWLSRISPLKAYGSLFFMVDESWALSLAEMQRGERSASFLIGAGLGVFITWNAGTVLGFTAGELLPPPESIGLDFAFTAMFIGLMALFWKGVSDLPPWLVAAAAALLSEALLPGKWYIVIGGLAGSLAGAMRYKKERP